MFGEDNKGLNNKLYGKGTDLF